MSPETFLHQYGYLALFLGVLIEGEAMVLAAGFAAGRGYLSPYLVFLVAAVSTLLGNQLAFWMGRRLGEALFAHRPRWREPAEKVRKKMRRFQTALILGYRFMYGIRSIVPLALGAGSVDGGKFALFNSLGALLWAGIFSLLGYLLGSTAGKLIRDIGRYEFVFLLALVFAGFAFGILRILRRRFSSR